MATKKPAKKSAAKTSAKPARPAVKAKKSSAKAAVKSSKAHAAPADRAAHHKLAKELAAHLGVSEGEAIERALHELAKSSGMPGAHSFQAPAHSHPHETHAREPEQKTQAPAARQVPRSSDHSLPHSYLPRRLYLALDSRGLDGAGMPMEIIDERCTIGSGRRNTIWINSPQVETLHAQITQGDEGWIFEDLGSEHGTFFNDEKITRRVIEDGDLFKLAGYLRVQALLK